MLLYRRTSCSDQCLQVSASISRKPRQGNVVTIDTAERARDHAAASSPLCHFERPGRPAKIRRFGVTCSQTKSDWLTHAQDLLKPHCLLLITNISLLSLSLPLRNMAPTVLHVRAETKPLEYRTAIPPVTAKQLVEAGYTVNIEQSPLSAFKDSEYEGTGATLVPTGSWIDAPSDHIVIGLKELPEEDFPLKHTHVQFAHCTSYCPSCPQMSCSKRAIIAD